MLRPSLSYENAHRSRVSGNWEVIPKDSTNSLFPRQPLNQRLVLRIPRTQLHPLRQLKVRKIKSRRDRASHHRKRLPIRHMRREPASRRHHRLQDLPRIRVTPQQDREIPPLRLNPMHDQRITRIEVPNFIRAKPMECRKVFLLQQKVNRGRCCPRTRKTCWQRLACDHSSRPVSLTKIPALGMRVEAQLLDPVPSISVSHASLLGLPLE